MKSLKTLLLAINLLCCQFLFAQTADSTFYLNILQPFYESIPSSEFGGAEFGPFIGEPIYGLLEYATDGIDNLACGAVNNLNGKIALADRGSCTFIQKTVNVEAAGAIALIICNLDDQIVDMAATDNTEVNIPTILLPFSTCQQLKIALDSGGGVELGFSLDPSPVSKIEGVIADDENENCAVDANENTLADFKVTATKGDYTRTTFSDDLGNYNLYLDTGNYVVQVFPPSQVWENCADPATVIFPEYDLTETVDFPMESTIDCAVMSVDIASPLLRRCFENNYHINYCNLGSIPAEDAFVTITLDELFTILSSSIPYTSDNNTYTFELGDVDYGVCDNFSFVAELSCDAELGMTFCTEAVIYPDDNSCIESAVNWDGVDVRVEGNCDSDEVIFAIHNTGENDMTESLSYSIIRNAEFLESGTFILTSGGTQNISFPADGATYRLEAKQSANHPWANLPSTTVEACSTDGVFTTGFHSMFPVADYGESYDLLCQEVIGSFDPNDKQGFPTGYGENHYIEKNVDLHYLIRFQNTGTDTAFTVKIEDEISEHFDMTTFRPGASSHNYTIDITDNLVLFTFNDIMLPDSFVNEPGSNGWLEYEIAQKANLPLETVIENSAAIYFDFNEPVITNTTVHTVGENFLSVPTKEIVLKENTLNFVPNPVEKGQAIFIEGIGDKNVAYELYNTDGKLLRNGMTDFGKINLSKNIQTGVYIIKVTKENGTIESGRIVIH